MPEVKKLLYYVFFALAISCHNYAFMVNSLLLVRFNEFVAH